MSLKTRSELAVQFADGERPDGEDFRDIFDSCLSKLSDGLSVDGDQTLVLSRGLKLGNSAATGAGGLRFNGGQVQFNDGTAWQPVGGSSGAFTAPGTTGTTGAVAYGGGNVGIGNFTAGTPPTYKFEVNLGQNSAVGEQVRFGNAVCCNGSLAFSGFGVFAHRNHATNNNYALRQSPTGAVQLNVPTAQILSIRQNDNTVLAVAANGRVIIGGLETNLTGSSNQALQVDGGAFRTGTVDLWSIASDARLKEDIRDLEMGLVELRRVRPVRFRFNGRGGQKAGQAGIGVLGQEIEKILPETVEKVPASGASPDEIDDMRIFNGSSLTYLLINAVKQLAEKVDALEGALEIKKAAVTQ